MDQEQADRIEGKLDALARKFDALIAELVQQHRETMQLLDEADEVVVTCAMCRAAGEVVSNCPLCKGSGEG